MTIKTITKAFGVLLLLISCTLGYSQTEPPKKLKNLEGLEFVNGLAKLKRYTPNAKKPQPMLVDTLGNIYPLAIAVKALDSTILALDLSHQELTTIPDIVFNNPQLKVLFLNDNFLREVSEKISTLGQLIHLEVSNNMLKTLPAEISALKQLKHLNISGNMLKKYPQSLSTLPLQFLDISINLIDTLPAEFQRLQELTTLNLTGNKLDKLPKILSELPTLKKLNIGVNKLSSLTGIGRLHSLLELDIHNNALQSLPSDIGQLNNLRALIAHSNKLQSLPEQIGQFEQLQFLDINKNDLQALPTQIYQLENLRELHVQANKLTTLAKEIGHLQQLEILDISSNQIAALPETVGALTALRKLNLTLSGIKEIPPSLAQLDHLETITIDNWSFSDYDISLLKETLPIETLSLEVSIGRPGVKDTLAYNYGVANELPKAFLSLKQSAYAYGQERDWYKLSWVALLVEEYQASIDASLKIRPDETWLVTIGVDSRLALAYILNNEWGMAVPIFERWIGIKPPFQDTQIRCINTILKDIALLKKAGITHPDFEKVKTLFDADDEAPVFEDVKLIISNKN